MEASILSAYDDIPLPQPQMKDVHITLYTFSDQH